MKDSKGLALMCIIVLGTAALLGCSDAVPLAKVSGTVFYNDKPLEFGTIMLQPISGSPSSAVIQSDGTFELETRSEGLGSRVGINKVRVTCFEGQKPGANEGQEAEKPLGKSLIPRRFASFANGLTVEIKPGNNPPLEIRLTDN